MTDESIMLSVDDLCNRWGLDEDGIFTLWAKHGLRFFMWDVMRGYPTMRVKIHMPGREPYQLHPFDDIGHRLEDVEAFELHHGQIILKLGGRSRTVSPTQQHPNEDHRARQKRLVRVTAIELRNQHPAMSVKAISKRPEIRKFKKKNSEPYADKTYYMWCLGAFSGLSPGRPKKQK